MEDKKFADVAWVADDVLNAIESEELDLTWDKTQAETFLIENASTIRDAMMDAGWEILYALLRYESEINPTEDGNANNN